MYQITSLEKWKSKIIEYFLTHMDCVTKEFNLFSRTHEKVADKIFGSFYARMHIVTYLHVHKNMVLFKKWTQHNSDPSSVNKSLLCKDQDLMRPCLGGVDS